MSRRALAIAILSAGLAGTAVAEGAGRPGVVVEDVSEGSAFARAGLRAGDLLLAWERSPEPPANPEGAAGEVRTVFDWLWMKAEQAPRGTVRLRGERSGEALSIEIPQGAWDGLRVRPAMLPDLVEAYAGGRRRIDAGDLEAGIALWDPIVERAGPELRCWIRFETGEAWSKGGRGARAQSALQSALTDAQDPPTRIAIGEALGKSYELPVAGLAERRRRLLILPDGPLHRLPFGALIRHPGSGAPGRRQFLAEWKPLHTALSLTAYETLRSSAGKASAGARARLVAFGDPRYPKVPAAAKEGPDSFRGALVLRSFEWTSLPHTRREIERLAETYPGARLYLGEDATEERAKSVSRDAGILHFATHGFLDDRTPLDSALVLTIPEELPAGRDNGLLQVWEIFESVRLDADLVVLSACESALGRELSGEGMIGLTRAFQYAGARSVVASLWSVADQATAELMVRFYRHRAAGLAKDEALRRAQIELIRGPIRITAANGQTQEMDASPPFFWAAFQLFGDWR